jgi:rhodanese-related sulfurtransferase
MRLKSLTLLNVSLSLIVLGSFTSWPLAAEDVPRITKEELKERLGNSDVIVLDVRESQNWQDSEFKIKGATRQPPRIFDSWADQYPKDKTLVLY